jgi:hypothetical protein
VVGADLLLGKSIAEWLLMINELRASLSNLTSEVKKRNSWKNKQC